ncbi:hypothetical protein [Cytobacillus firmus]|uniref:hypothetical protein n=1 Tax=Cytobacillus firmus TaxID=1399 RepID=UPI002163D044|nr:hypothetical protein [Cytobacillus firmus]MCS0674529.1 hypothetical protein [Cytobacillus firmus]
MEFVISNVQLLYGEELVCKKGLALWIKDGSIKEIIPESQLPHNIKIIDGNRGA